MINNKHMQLPNLVLPKKLKVDALIIISLPLTLGGFTNNFTVTNEIASFDGRSRKI